MQQWLSQCRYLFLTHDDVDEDEIQAPSSSQRTHMKVFMQEVRDKRACTTLTSDIFNYFHLHYVHYVMINFAVWFTLLICVINNM